MHSLFILGFIAFETLFLSFGNAKDVNLESSPHLFVPEQTIHGTVTPIKTTEDVSTRIKHIPREIDQSSAKVVVQPAMTLSQPTERKNSTERASLNATNKTNSTGPTKELSTKKIVIKHIPREKRDSYREMTMPFNFDALHAPCDTDINFFSMYKMPGHCQWIISQRFHTVMGWRAYNLIKVEGFFFGQYWQRLRHYELDAHIFGQD